MQTETENREFVQDVYFAFIDSLKIDGTKYLLIFEVSRTAICNSKEFDDKPTAGKHCGSSTIYNKHNLFHQSRLGRARRCAPKHHLFLLKTPRDVMQASTLSDEMRFGAELVDW